MGAALGGAQLGRPEEADGAAEGVGGGGFLGTEDLGTVGAGAGPGAGRTTGGTTSSAGRTAKQWARMASAPIGSLNASMASRSS